MRRFYSAIMLALIAVMALGTISVENAKAQGLKIGIIDDEKIKAGYDAFARAQEEFDVEYKAWQEEARTMETDLQEMFDEYERQRLILSEEKRLEKEASIRVKQEALEGFTRQIFGPGGTAEKKMAQLQMPLQENVTRAMQIVAETEGFDVIFTMASGIGYIKPSYDVTEKVLSALEDLE